MFVFVFVFVFVFAVVVVVVRSFARGGDFHSKYHHHRRWLCHPKFQHSQHRGQERHCQGELGIAGNCHIWPSWLAIVRFLVVLVVCRQSKIYCPSMALECRIGGIFWWFPPSEERNREGNGKERKPRKSTQKTAPKSDQTSQRSAILLDCGRCKFVTARNRRSAIIKIDSNCRAKKLPINADLKITI